MGSTQLSDVLITFQSASHIPIGDWLSHSSDPYLYARLTPRTPPSLEHPPFPLTFRTSTLQHTRDPEWNETWHLGGIPPEGFDLEVKIMDENKPGDFDDRLGIAYLSVTRLPPAGKEGELVEASHYILKIKKRKASRRAYAATYVVAWCNGDFKKQRGRGRLTHTRPPQDEEDASVAAKIKQQGLTASEKPKPKAHPKKKQNSTPYLFEANKIQLLGTLPADLRNKYVDYRPFIGWMFTGRGIRGWLLQRGLHAQHRRVYTYNPKTQFGHVATPPAIEKEQVVDVENLVPEHEKPENEAADEFAASRQFLKMVHYDEAPVPGAPGGRLYTYIITLQGEWRFTETGPEFAIQFLSKHSMHSDVAPEIAVAGEFFVRRRRGKGGMPLSEDDHGAEAKEHANEKEKQGDNGEEMDVDQNTEASRKLSNTSNQAPKAPGKNAIEESTNPKNQTQKYEDKDPSSNKHSEEHKDKDPGSKDQNEKAGQKADKDSIDISNKPSHATGHRSRHPSNFVLIIDNDSGTYRPDKSQLPSLQKYLERNLPGLKVKAMACDDPKLKKWKEEQKPKKEIAKTRYISQPSSTSDNDSSSNSE